MNYTWILHGVWILYLIVPCIAQENNSTLKPTHVRLTEHLMKGYNKGVRPVQDWRKVTNVYVDIMMYAILGVDEKNQILTTYIWNNQSWVDEFLTWDPEEFDNITRISIPTQWIWEPDVLVMELVDPGKSVEDKFVHVHHNGKIRNSKPLLLKSTCNFDMYYFPFDGHNCSLTFTASVHTIEEVNVFFRSPETVDKSYTSEYADIGEWDIVSVTPSYIVANYESYIFGETTFHIKIRRKPLFYTVSLITPSMLLMILNMAAFYLPPESGERTSFKITLLLGYSVFLLIVSEKCPPTGTPLIGSYFTMCMVLLGISIMESIFIIRIVHQENHNRPVPKWVKTLVLQKMASLICLKDEDHFTTSCSTESDVSEQNASSSTEKLTNYNNENMKHCNLQLSTTKTSEVLLRILKEIVSIQEGLKKITDQGVSKEWIHIGHVIDLFLFRTYIIVVLVYTVAMAAVWTKQLYS
ncbi:serotonin-gated cation-selective channel activity [Pristimantis euphronides]